MRPFFYKTRVCGGILRVCYRFDSLLESRVVLLGPRVVSVVLVVAVMLFRVPWFFYMILKLGARPGRLL